jgi:predicted AAA+ superfamily ATPase
MERVYKLILHDHFQNSNKSAFLSGPRQVGKTTIALDYGNSYTNNFYFTWDSLNDRQQLLAGQKTLLLEMLSSNLSTKPIVVILDEIHKYKDWKNYVKGFIDLSKDRAHTIVTGSSKLNVYRRGGDSMMGRYFLYRIHPLSLREITAPSFSLDVIQMPVSLAPDALQQLFDFGGFPEPFVNGTTRFHKRWQLLRHQQLFTEDIRELTRIQEIKLLETLTAFLQLQAAQLLNYATLASKVRVSEPTIRTWIETLEQFYYCFTVRPWQGNLARSLIKTPKLFLWDWSLVIESGHRWENLIACHLYKAVDFWTDAGFGAYALYYVRDKEHREVDFLITKDSKPWALIEVKSSAKEPISKWLLYYQKATQAPYAFQVVIDLPYKELNCFSCPGEVKIVPATTFLLQLI